MKLLVKLHKVIRLNDMDKIESSLLEGIL